MSKAVTRNLKYDLDLQIRYKNFATLPGFVLLESSDRSRGRYDILSAYPYNQITITHDTEDKSTVLAYLKQSLNSQKSTLDLPFQGGAIGYISYDLGAQLLGIYSIPQPTLKTLPLLDMGLYDWAIIVDHQLQKVTFYAANTQQSTADFENEMISLWYKDPECLPEFKLESDFCSLISKQEYINSFETIYQALKKGRSYQVNLTQAFHASYTGDAWNLYEKVKAKNPVPFSAFLRTSQAAILSFSPERFLFHKNYKLLTSPIKGTIARSSDVTVDKELQNQLVACEKNRAENVMIVDLLRNDLGKISKPGSVKVTQLCALQSYNSVHHLVSDIESTCLETIHPLDAFFSCFPGGSITGAPKREAMKIINEQEPFGRSVYCGAIGYFSSHGQFDTNIAIRTVIAKDQRLHLAAGGGLVIDSKAEEEYAECYTKIAAIVKNA